MQTSLTCEHQSIQIINIFVYFQQEREKINLKQSLHLQAQFEEKRR